MDKFKESMVQKDSTWQEYWCSCAKTTFLVVFSIYDVVSKKAKTSCSKLTKRSYIFLSCVPNGKKARTSCSKLKNDPIFSYPAFEMATTFHFYVLEPYKIVGVWHLNYYVFPVPVFFLSRVPNGASVGVGRVMA
jgi:hypothetical protein